MPLALLSALRIMCILLWTFHVDSNPYYVIMKDNPFSGVCQGNYSSLGLCIFVSTPPLSFIYSFLPVKHFLHCLSVYLALGVAPPTHPPPKISMASVYCTESSFLMSSLYLFSKTYSLVKCASNGNPWGTGVQKDVLEVQGYKKIWIDRKGSSRNLKEHNF